MALLPTCRQFTGQAWRFRAYVLDTETGKPVMACNHKHRSKWRTPGGKNGEYYAMQCARKMLRRLLAQAKENKT